MADEQLNLNKVNTMYPSPSGVLYAYISDLVPWKLENIQIVKTPKANRWIAELMASHRVAALKHNDGLIDARSVKLSGLNALRERFSKPVALGIFVFGDAPEDKDDKKPLTYDPDKP
jgi:hypothetical protein